MPASNKAGVRPLRRPPPELDRVKIPRTRQPERNWFRVHRSEHSPLFFSVNSNHRFSHPESPYPMLYLGFDVHTCLFERFGDEIYEEQKTLAFSLWAANSVSIVSCPPLRICDLTNARTLSSLRVDLTALTNDKLELPQEWSLAIQHHPAHFQGIKYKSRFNGKACLALFDRDGIKDKLRDTMLGALPALPSAANWLHKHKVRLY